LYWASPFNGEPTMPVEFSDGRSLMRPRYEFAEIPSGMEVRLPPANTDFFVVSVEAGTPGAIEQGGKAFLVFGSRMDIPAEYSGTEIAARRGGRDEIRADAGFGEATGMETTLCGPVPLFNFMIGRGYGGLESDWAGIASLLRSEEATQYREALEAAEKGDAKKVQSYLYWRLPEGYGLEEFSERGEVTTPFGAPEPANPPE